jgi:hypothetical protein
MDIIVDDELYEAIWVYLMLHPEVALEDLGFIVVPRDTYDKMWEDEK